MLKVCIYVRSEWGRAGPIFYCSARPGPELATLQQMFPFCRSVAGCAADPAEAHLSS